MEQFLQLSERFLVVNILKSIIQEDMRIKKLLIRIKRLWQRERLALAELRQGQRIAGLRSAATVSGTVQ